MQLWRQQAVDPRRLVDALTSDEHDDLVVDDGIVHPAGNHRHEPLGETLAPECLFGVGGHVDHRRRLTDIVGQVGCPGGQREHVVAQRVHLGHDVRVEHGAEEPVSQVHARLGAAGQVEVVLVAFLQLAP